MTQKFSFDTIPNFDSHILESIPNYDVLFNNLLILSDYFLMNKYNVFDVGCSTGKLLQALDEKNPTMNCNYFGLDISTHLLPKEVKSVKQKYILEDLNTGKFEFKDACLVFSIFTLQFLNQDARPKLLKQIYNGLNSGGGFILTEKVYCENGKFQDIFTSSYYDHKKKYFSEKQILDKEVDLRKILKPNTHAENIELLKEAGFKQIETFYQYLNFRGYLAIK